MLNHTLSPRSCETAGVLFYSSLLLFYLSLCSKINLLPWYEISFTMLTFAADIGQVASGGAAASEMMSE